MLMMQILFFSTHCSMMLSLDDGMIEDSRFEELRQQAKAKYLRQTKAIFAKKKREGYLFWCPAISDKKHHRVYFRSLQSAEDWMIRLRKSGIEGQIHSLDEEIVW
jgi:hypothetical protein